MAATEAVYRAIADPTRRTLLDLLQEGEQAVRELCASFSISQPALSKHLRVLREAGLVQSRQVGRERRYSLRAAGLRGVGEWVAHYERFWNEKLDALGELLEQVDG